MEAALAQKKGVIFITPHIGSWELLGQAIGERFVDAHGPMTALYRPARKAWMSELVAASRENRRVTLRRITPLLTGQNQQ